MRTFARLISALALAATGLVGVAVPAQAADGLYVYVDATATLQVVSSGSADDAILVNAGPGDVGEPDGWLYISSLGAVTAGPGCQQTSDIDVARCYAKADWGLGPYLRLRIDTGEGNDWVKTVNASNVTGYLDPTVVLGTGNDSFYGGPGNDTVHAWSGNDLVYGGPGNDTVYGGDGDDKIKTYEGNDQINGGSGNDQQFGGVGMDTFTSSYLDGSDTMVGNEDEDLVNYGGRWNPVKVLLCGRGGCTGNGEPGENDYLSVESAIGGSGNDTLTGDEHANRLTGGTGNDLLTGGAGADVLGGGLGSDTVSYAERTVAITADIDGVADDGSAGERDRIAGDVEKLIGGAAQDRLTGSGAANTLTGGAGNDFLYGLAGNDVLNGGLGIDTVTGGTGTDRCSAETRITCEP